jgi:hypothetical protein
MESFQSTKKNASNKIKDSNIKNQKNNLSKPKNYSSVSYKTTSK